MDVRRLVQVMADEVDAIRAASKNCGPRSIRTRDSALARGELSYAKVRELTRVATPETEERLLAVGRAGTADHWAGVFLGSSSGRSSYLVHGAPPTRFPLGSRGGSRRGLVVDKLVAVSSWTR